LAQCAKNHAETAENDGGFGLAQCAKMCWKKQTVMCWKKQTENKQSCHCVSHDEAVGYHLN
jgi:hypothetical protein